MTEHELIKLESNKEFKNIRLLYYMMKNHEIQDINKVISNNSKPVGEYDLITKHKNKLISWEIKQISFPEGEYSIDYFETCLDKIKKQKNKALKQLNRNLNNKLHKKFAVFIYKIDNITFLDIINEKNKTIAVICYNGNESKLFKSRNGNLTQGYRYIQYIISRQVFLKPIRESKLRKRRKNLKNLLKLSYNISEQTYEWICLNYRNKSNFTKEEIKYLIAHKKEKHKYEIRNK